MAQQSTRRCRRCAAPRTLAPMKTLLKLALAGALAAILVRWARQWSTDARDGLPTVKPVRDAEPNRRGALA